MAENRQLADRVTDLEITVAHQDQRLEELSDVIRDQWGVIDRLKRHLDLLTTKYQEMQDKQSPPGNVKPPHY